MPDPYPALLFVSFFLCSIQVWDLEPIMLWSSPTLIQVLFTWGRLCENSQGLSPDRLQGERVFTRRSHQGRLLPHAVYRGQFLIQRKGHLPETESGPGHDPSTCYTSHITSHVSNSLTLQMIKRLKIRLKSIVLRSNAQRSPLPSPDSCKAHKHNAKSLQWNCFLS